MAGEGYSNWCYETGYRRYQDVKLMPPWSWIRRPWQALLWGAESLPVGSIAAPTESILLPEAGFAVLRAGPPENPRYLAFDFRPHGGGHGHSDKLGYISYARHKALGVDPGVQSYGDGYDYLENNRAAIVNMDWQATWDVTGLGKSWGGTWRNSADIRASFTVTDVVASNGLLSAQLDYDSSSRQFATRCC